MYKKRLNECVDKYKKSLTVKSKKKLAIISTAAVSVTAGLVAGIIIALMRNTNIKTNHYSVTFVANTDKEGKGTIQKKSEKTFNDVTKLDAGYAPDPLDNYKFDYWVNEKQQKVEFPVTIGKNEKYFAKWSPAISETYTVKFVTGEGASPIGDYSVLKGESISRPESTKEHFALKAWHEGSLEGKEVFMKQATGGYEKYEPKGNVTIFAEWEQKEFNVGLALDEGKAPSGAQEVEIGGTKYSGYPYVSKLDTAPIPTKNGFDFMGWYETSAKEGNPVKFPYEPKADSVLYAKWEQSSESKQITIDAGGGFLPKVGEETSDPKTRTITTGYIPYAPTAYYDATYKDKYELEGWYDAASGGNQITFPHIVNDKETIYAHWKQVRFKATVYGNSTQEGTTERKLNSWDNLALVRYADIPDPKEGDMKLGTSGSAADHEAYTLDHWDVFNLDDEGKKVKEEPAGNLNIDPLKYNAKINASWAHTKFTVTLHASKEEGAATEELKYQTTETLGSKGPSVPDNWVSAHSEFTGWNDINGNKIDFSTYKLTQDADFYMSEEIAMGKVYLHTAYAKGSTTYNGTEDWYYTDKYKELGAGFAARDLPEKEHYKKLGWTYTTDDSEPSTSSIIYNKEYTEQKGKIHPWPAGGVRPTANGIAHLYPTYEQSQFEIRFNVGEKATACNSVWTGDKDASGNAKIPTGTAIPTSSKTFSTFKGWSLTDGGAIVDLHNVSFTKDTEVYAIWETSAWTVTFNALESDATYDKYTKIDSLEGITKLSSGTLSDMTNYVKGKAVRDNSIIAGWSSEKPTSEADTYDISKISTEFTIEKDTQLYAIYNKTDVKITIDLNGASVGGKTEAQTIQTTSGSVASAEVWKNLLEEQKGTIVAPTSLPNFVGWSLNGELIKYPYILEAGSELSIKMVWANTEQFMVTFNANNGDFYYKSGGVLKTTPLVSYLVDLNDTYWKSNSPTLANVYNKAKESVGGVETDYLVREGYTLDTTYKFTMNGIGISDSYVINTSAGFYANWNAVKSEGDWFADSLTTIASYATSEDSLKTQYSAAYSGTKANQGAKVTRTKSAGTLLGLEVEIKIPTVSSSLSYFVRVIGVGQDSIVSTDTTKKKACLTFEFVDCPVFGCFAPDGAGRDARYDKSIIRNSTLPYLLNTMPSSLTSLFKTVYKPYLTSGSDKTYSKCTTMNTDETSLFILSAYEYGGSTSKSASVEENKKNDYTFAYKYYSVIGDSTSDKRKHYIPDETTVTPNWTRTPRNSTITSGLTDYDVCFISGESGKYGSVLAYDPMSGYGIAPAFCIGVVS